MKNVLVACECSQTVCMAFRKRGFNAFSCDIVKQYGGHPDWHILGNCLNVININEVFFHTQDDKQHIIKQWDLIIAHPPCTFLCNTQAPLYNTERFGVEKVRERLFKKLQAIDFFLDLTEIQTRWAIENPVGCMSKIFRKPDQIIQPYEFGEPATKRTCFWLNGLPKLKPTHIIDRSSLKTHKFPGSNPMGEWYYKTSCLPKDKRAIARSKTFDGIAEAMAEQWGDFILSH